ncbi:MAG: aspartate kinase [Desulfurellaceae bacterium]|nr:aspartate kinase [Desulfurellaceae bacterium]
MLIVQKYGGTSVGSSERIKAVARRIAETRDAGHQVAVVVSAMSGETDRLLGLARQVTDRPDAQASDLLVSTGEQVTVALLSMTLKDMGYPTQPLLGHQVEITTDSAFGRARIQRIATDRLTSALNDGAIVVVAGFQGVDADDNITTLGRGGSDTSAVAIAAVTRADVCEIYTDVDGVYTADPRICPRARKMQRISYDEMLELASLGAKVLQIRSVEFAKRHHVAVHVRSSFAPDTGTFLVEEEPSMEDVIVSGVTSDLNQAKITLLRVPDRPGLAAKLFGPIADDNIVVDMIIQNASAEGSTDLTFTVPQDDVQKALSRVAHIAEEIRAGGVTSDTQVAKVSIVGLGMRSHAGVASRMFQVLAREGINIQMISTSEIKISIVIEAKYRELAVRVLHDEFIAPAQ